MYDNNYSFTCFFGLKTCHLFLLCLILELFFQKRLVELQFEPISISEVTQDLCSSKSQLISMESTSCCNTAFLQ